MFSQSTVQVKNLITSITAGLTLPQGESNPSAEISVVNPVNNGVNQLTMPTLSGNIVPSGWRIYRGTSPGTEEYLTTLSGDSTVFYDDGTLVGTSTPPPSASYGYLGSLPTNISAPTITNLGSAFTDLAFAGTTTAQNIAYDSWAMAQPFVAHSTNLDSINLPIGYHGNPHSITVSIYPETLSLTNSNQNYIPNTYTSSASAIPLGTVTLSVTQCNNFSVTGQYTRFAFPTTASLNVGQVYYIVVQVTNSADTIASTNYFTWYGSFNGSSLTTCYNRIVYGYGYNITAANGSNNGNGNGAWVGNISGAFGYQINGQGTLSSGTYYYIITACTGFVQKSVFSGYDNTGNMYNGSVYFCSGDGTDSFYPVLVSNGSYNTVYCGMYEKYGIQTHLIGYFNGFNFTNNTQVANQSYTYNLNVTPGIVNSGAISSTSNVTFRLHNYSNYFYLNVAGDSANSGFQEFVNFVGVPTPLGSGDKPHVVSGNANGWLELRDYANAVNSYIYPLIATTSAKLFQNGNNYDAFPYYNSYTGNNDGITLTLADNYGVRATLPNMILVPHGSSSSINNHDTFVINGQTYIYYQTLNYAGSSPNYRPFSIWSFGNGGNFVTDFYPAIQIS